MYEGVRIRVRGRMPERFVQKALSAGACFHEIDRRQIRVVELVTDPAGAKKVLALAEEYGLEAETVALTGLSALRQAVRRRVGLLCGVFLCSALVMLYSRYYWRVEVVSLDGTGGQARVEEALAALGAKPGTRRDSLDPDLLRAQLRRDLPELCYVGVRARGAVLRVETAREHPAPALYDADAARDLVASRDAVVLDITVRSGIAAVRVGDTVRRGQLLIRGEERVSKEETRGLSALGEVLGRAWYEGECTLPRTSEERVRTGRRSSESRLSLMGWSLPLSEGEAFPEAEEQREELPLVGLFLPLKIVRTTRYETVSRQVAPGEGELARRAAEAAMRLATAQLSPEDEIMDAWTDYTAGAQSLTARAVVEVRTDIAVPR